MPKCDFNKVDQIRESEIPANDSRVSFILFFPSKHLFFSCLLFPPINLKSLSSVFLISDLFSPITSSCFYHRDVIMQIQD